MCGEIFEFDFVLGSNCVSDCLFVRVISGVKRVLVRDEVFCDCLEC